MDIKEIFLELNTLFDDDVESAHYIDGYILLTYSWAKVRFDDSVIYIDGRNCGSARTFSTWLCSTYQRITRELTLRELIG